MQYEVETKFAVLDLESMRERLLTLGTRFEQAVDQSDLYFAHPARDFARTDEAFRIRRVGERNFVTYKGPKIDSHTKTRKELELQLPEGMDVADDFGQLFAALGFSPVAEVRKRRIVGTFIWQGNLAAAALDEVDRVGTYVELEMTAEEETLEVVRDSLMALAEKLELAGAERRSYLELLLGG